MADTEEGEGTNTRRNEWEVVSLTASAYAAAPGPNDVEENMANTQDEAGTSRALFMSGHFVFPPSQHENLPLEPEDNEILEEHRGKDDVPELGIEGGSGKEDRDHIFGIAHDEFQGEFEEVSKIQHSNQDKNYSATSFSSSDNEIGLDGTKTYSDSITAGGVESENNSDLPAESLQLSKPMRDDDFHESDLPCGAWWKKRAASLYAHAKEANAFWSICIAAAVMGLVILGQQWQQERWQVLQSKWHLTIKDEKMGRMLGPISRIKDVIVGGHRRGSFIRGSSAGDN